MEAKTISKTKDYVCPWCNNKFQAPVVYQQGYGNSRASRHKGCMSSQVKCPRCLNYIPTWKKEETGNVVGRKHIHLRGY
jgi:hypothetical protein